MLVILAAIAIVVVIVVAIVEHRRTTRVNDVDVDSCLRNVSRLNAVAASGLMDAPRRQDLDALTTEAAQRLHVPVALMSVLDDHRAFVVSDFGLQGEVARRREHPAQHTYCKYVVARDSALSVPDSHRDPTFKRHPATLDEGVRSYLGVPIRGGSGEAIGSFCVIDSGPRQWSAEDRRTLEEIARRAMSTAARR